MGQARDAVARYSWDQIAKALGMTRWSVLRRFGPHGNRPAIEKAEEKAADRPSPVLPAVTPVPAGAPTVPQLPGSLPQEIGDRVIYLVGELVSESIRDGRLSMRRPAEVRIEVLSEAIRVDVSRWGPPNRRLLEANADRWGDREGNPPGVWFELDLRPSADVGQ